MNQLPPPPDAEPLESNRGSQPSSVATPPQSGHHAWYADLCLMLTAIMWGINIPVVKYAFGHVEPYAFNASRLVFATLILGIFAAVESRRGLAIRGPYSRTRWLGFALLNGLLYMVLFLEGVHRTTAGNVALLLSSMPVWTAVFSFLFLGERLKKITWAGLAVTMVGTFIVIVWGRSDIDFSSSLIVGNLIMLLAAMTWAGGTVLSRKLLESVGPLTLAFWCSLITTPVHVLLARNSIVANWDQLTQPNIILAVLFSGFGSTGLAYALWHVGVRQLGGSHASIYQNLVTLVAVLGGWIFLAESPLVSQIAGGVLIICGLFIMRKGRS